MAQLKIAVIGASGYIGNELAGLLYVHPNVAVLSLYVSEQSKISGKLLSDVYKKWQSVSLPLQALTPSLIKTMGSRYDVVFLATPHNVSHTLAPELLEQGVKVFDLSGGFRLSTPEQYQTYYHFMHEYAHWLKKKVYGLPEWSGPELGNADLIAVGGCYASAAQLALLPLTYNGLVKENHPLIVHGMSGVSGAGKVVNTHTQFCEVSLKPYGIFSHRHQPEIEQQIKHNIVFTPHLCPFKRGLMVTCSAALNDGISAEVVKNVFCQAYDKKPFIVFPGNWPSVNDVAYTPYCHIHWEVKESSQQIVIVAVLDNLLKGAASQAVQCFNLSYGWDEKAGLLPEAKSMQNNGDGTLAMEGA